MQFSFMNIVSADALSPIGARPSADTKYLNDTIEVTTFLSCVIEICLIVCVFTEQTTKFKKMSPEHT